MSIYDIHNILLFHELFTQKIHSLFQNNDVKRTQKLTQLLHNASNNDQLEGIIRQCELQDNNVKTYIMKISNLHVTIFNNFFTKSKTFLKTSFRKGLKSPQNLKTLQFIKLPI